jgi:hypothetical protein
MKTKKAIIIIIILLSLLGIYILQSLYLTLRISVSKNDRYEDVPYKENAFISEKFYDYLTSSPGDYGQLREELKHIDTDYYKTGMQFTIVGFGKAYYVGEYEQKFSAIDSDNEKVRFGSVAILYVDMELKNFRWVVTKVWEPA